ncbi:MAG: Ig domain-containing protein, partial [Paludibacteraceae bacterium]
LSADNLTYTLTKKADVSLPAGAVIQFAGHAFSWTIGTESPYFLNPDMKYSYGVSCAALDAPTNVAVTAEGVITFTGVEGAEKYIAHIYNGTTLVGTEEVTNGATLAFQSYVAATYTVKVVATALGMSDSPESEGVTWAKAADPLPASKFCAEPADKITANNGYCSPLFTIQTQANGNVTIVVSAGEGNEGETMFHGTNGMNGTFTLNGSAEDFNTYFTKAKTDDYTVTLTLVSADNKPAPGAVISYSGQIEIRSSVNTNDWSNYVLNDYLYGTTCPTDVAVTGVTLDVTAADLPLNKTLTLHATVAPANAANRAVTWASSEEGVATVADGVVTPIAEGTTTITVTTVDGNFTATCEVTVKPAVATEPAAAPAAPTYPANQVKAIYSATYDADCNFGEWESGTTYVQDTYGKKFVTTDAGYFGLVDFALNCAAMETFHADVWVENNCSMRFVPITGQAEQGVTKDLVGGQWNSIEIALNEGAWANTTNWTNVYQLKIDNAKNLTFWMNNIYFYTTSVVDAEKPVMSAATVSLESASFTSAVLTVTGATDNVGVIRYLVKNGETEVGKFVPADDKITVTGLPANTSLTLSVFAMDAADNVSDDYKEVAVTTPDYPAPAAAPNLTNKTVLAIYADGIDLAVAHDFNLNTWGGAKYDLVEKDGQNYILYNAATNWTAWGVDNDGADAIVGKDECKGTKGGVNVSAMEYLHVDVWTDASCPSFEVFVNDSKLGGQALEGEGWHSVDLPLLAYPANPVNDWGLDNVNWMKFVGWNGVKYVGLDNVYFWKDNG